MVHIFIINFYELFVSVFSVSCTQEHQSDALQIEKEKKNIKIHVTLTQVNMWYEK